MSLQIHDVILQNDVAGPSDVVCSTDTSGLWPPVYFYVNRNLQLHQADTYEAKFFINYFTIKTYLQTKRLGKNSNKSIT